MAKRDFSRGSIEQMMDAFQNKLVELGGDYTSDIDDVVQSADEITAAYRDDVIDMESDPYVETDNGNIEEGSYADVLIGDINAQLEDSGHLDSWTWEYNQDTDELQLTTIEGSNVSEYTIPMEDLTQDINSIDDDIQYIMAEVMKGDDVESCDSIQSDTEIAEDDDDEDMEDFMHFGLKKAKKFGDMICKKLSGKTVSKNKMLAKQPGGLIYEANKLGIDMWDLLEALEGMCYQGRAREIDDSTYKVLGNCARQSKKVNSSTEVNIRPGDEEIIYGDPDCMFGDGSDISLSEIKEYWNSNSTNDPTLAQYSSFKDWWKDTRKWLTASCDVKAAIRENADSDVLYEDVTPEDYDINSMHLRRNYSDPAESCANIEGACGEFDKWEEVKSKQVPDTDGFFTDYTLYFNPFTGEYMCMFGDKDIYTPDFDYADWSGDSEQEAMEWFNDYEGFVEDEHEFDPDDYEYDEENDIYNATSVECATYDELPEGYTSAGNVGGYFRFRRIVDGKGKWIAQHQDGGPFFDISYEQALGYEPIDESNIAKLQRDLGEMLLPPEGYGR